MWAAEYDVGQIANYGVLGTLFLAFAAAILSGNLVAGWVYKRAEKRSEEATLKHEKALADQAAKYEKLLADQVERSERELERERSEKVALRSRVDEQVVPLLADTGHLLREALRTLGRDGKERGSS